MTALRVAPAILSFLVLGAHFYRAGNFVLVAVAVAAPLLLLLRKPWVVPAIQVALFVGGAEWIRTAVSIGSIRATSGQPAARMFLILGAVALFTILSAIPLSRLEMR